MRTEALICNSEIKLPNQECICILEYCHKKLKSLHFHVLLWKLGFHTEKKKKRRNRISEIEFADIPQEQWSSKFQVFLPDWIFFY